jgi:V/A-type H+-transporting ATPase subunit K
MPSSQTIYGIVVTMALRRELTIDNAPGIFGIGILTGLALMISAFAQGSTCAAAINASKSKLEIFGISLAPAALVEGFSVFAFVFALVLSAGIPK